MLKALVSLFFLFISFIRIAAQQESYADSLRRELVSAKEDTNKVWLLINLGVFYQWSYPDSGILYAQEASRLAQKLNFTPGEIRANSVAYEAFSGKGNYPKALEASLKQLELSEKSGDSTNIVWAYVGIGSVYYYSDDYERALYYYNKLKLNHAIFLQNQEIFSGFLGETYFHLNELDSAFYYTKMCYDLDLKIENHWPVPYFYLGQIYSQKKEYASALDFYRRGVNISIEKQDLLDGYIGIAGIFKKLNLIDSAVYFARRAIDLVHDGSFPSHIVKAGKILTDIYTANHVADSAFRYMQIMMVAKDSLFNQTKQNLYFNEQAHQQELRQKIEQEQSANRNQQNIIILLSGLTIVLVVAMGLWRKNIYKQKSYTVLQKQKQEIDIQKAKVEKALDELKTTQTQLIQSEKMASLGELTAGIAHEIQNPLNFVNNFSDVNKELLEELKEEADNGNIEQIKTIANNVINNEEKINSHGRRADAIVKGMLQHSRTSSRQKELTDINVLADEYLRLAYHGLRAKDKSFNSKFETNFDNSAGKINVVPQEIGRVILNLINNAFYAVSEKQKRLNGSFEPAVLVSTKKLDDKLQITVADNGNGIPQKNLDKIFQPFFTTKPAGQGTGLGLSLAYDIVTKGHKGEIKIETKEGEGSKFIVIIPSTQ
jgi:two-component system, NtrC family, sensor kinase